MDTAFTLLLDDFTLKLASPRVTKTPQAEELEAKGVFVWLKTLFPRSFRSSFCLPQEKFWYYAWQTMYKRLNNIPMSLQEYSMLVPFPRGLGKSTSGEALCIMEGAVVGEGYDLYLGDTDAMAEEHLYNIMELINQEQVEQFYPLLAKPRVNKLTGEQAGFSQQVLITEGNWSVTATGLRGSGGRGSRKGTLRFTMIVGDDLDRLDESMVVVAKKERTLARSVLGAGSTKMQFWFLQNPIHEGSIMNRALTGASELFSSRIVVNKEPTPAFTSLEIQRKELTDGRTEFAIDRTVTKSVWDYFDLDAADKFLAQSGPEAFLAEYQHIFDLKKDKVIPNFDRNAQVITWEMFEAAVGTRYIPQDWFKSCAADLGYTEKSNSAWAWCATANENVEHLINPDMRLAGKKFMYRAHNFVRHSIDRQMFRFWKAMFPDPETGRDYFEAEMNFGLYPSLFRILYLDPRCRPYLTKYTPDMELGLWRHPEYNLSPFFYSTVDAFQISHEKSGEELTIHEQYGVPVIKIKNFGAADGVTQWNQMCWCDHTVPNPFIMDTPVKDEETGLTTWEIGSPDLFYIVDAKEYEHPVSDRGLKKNIESVAKWKYVLQNATESGIQEPKPMKMEGGDSVDAERAIYATFGPNAKPLTQKEQFARHVQAHTPYLTDKAIGKLLPEQQGFAQVEKIIYEEKWKKGNSTTIKPAGLENLDF